MKSLNMSEQRTLGIGERRAAVAETKRTNTSHRAAEDGQPGELTGWNENGEVGILPRYVAAQASNEP